MPTPKYNSSESSTEGGLIIGVFTGETRPVIRAARPLFVNVASGTPKKAFLTIFEAPFPVGLQEPNVVMCVFSPVEWTTALPSLTCMDDL